MVVMIHVKKLTEECPSWCSRTWVAEKFVMRRLTRLVFRNLQDLFRRFEGKSGSGKKLTENCTEKSQEQHEKNLKSFASYIFVIGEMVV
jgi:hypothetical protein